MADGPLAQFSPANGFCIVLSVGYWKYWKMYSRKSSKQIIEGDMEQLGKIFRKPLKTYCGGKTNAEIVILHYVEQKTLEMLRGRNVTYFLEKLI